MRRSIVSALQQSFEEMAPQSSPLRPGRSPRNGATPSWRCFWRSWYSVSPALPFSAPLPPPSRCLPHTATLLRSTPRHAPPSTLRSRISSKRRRSATEQSLRLPQQLHADVPQPHRNLPGHLHRGLVERIGSGLVVHAASPSDPRSQQYTLTISSTAPDSGPAHNGHDRHHRSRPPRQRRTAPGPPAKLVWLQTPTGGTAFSPVSPQPEVAVEDSQGDIVSSDFSSVTLAAGVGTDWRRHLEHVLRGGVLRHRAVLRLQHERRRELHDQGSRRKSDADPDHLRFTVAAATANKIGFTTTAVSGTASNSATLGPITVQQQDAFGNPVATTAPVTVNLSSSPGGTFSPTSGGTAITSVTIPPVPRRRPPLLLRRHDCWYSDNHCERRPVWSLAPSPRRSLAAPATKLVASSTSSPFTVASGTQGNGPVHCDARGHLSATPTTKTTATTINLTSSSTGTHEFATTSGGTAVTSVTLPANTSSVTLYYGDNETGTLDHHAAAATRHHAHLGHAAGDRYRWSHQAGSDGPASGSASSGAAIGPFTVTEETAAGVHTTVGETVNLTSKSTGTYVFNADTGGHHAYWCHDVTIPPGQSSATFYYGDTAAGDPDHHRGSDRTDLGRASNETITAASAAQLIFTTGTKSGTASNSATVGTDHSSRSRTPTATSATRP